MGSKPPILVHCVRTRHRWKLVIGTMATAENMYYEYRCVYCRRYESEVR